MAVLRMADEAQADGVFLCGDIIEKFNDITIQFVREQFQNTKTKIFSVPGNHEFYGAPDRKFIHEQFADLMFGNAQYWAQDVGGLLIVGLDNSDKNYTEEQISFLEKQTAKNKPILLLMHAPLKTESIIQLVFERWQTMGEGAVSFFLIDDAEDPTSPIRRFRDIVENPDNPVAAIFAGHIHLAHEGEFVSGRSQCTMINAYLGKMTKVIVTGE